MMAWLMGLERITPEQLSREIAQGAVTVIDVNDASRWRQAHVPGARNLVHDRFTADDLPMEKSRPLVFYCSNPMCRKAPIAARRARQLGFETIRVMSAGISGWLAARLPTENGGAMPMGIPDKDD